MLISNWIRDFWDDCRLGCCTIHLFPYLDKSYTGRICLFNCFWSSGACWKFTTFKGSLSVLGGNRKWMQKKNTKTVWQFLKKLKINYHVIQQFHFWVFTQKIELKVRPQWDNYTCMFKATLFIISKNRKLSIISKNRKLSIISKTKKAECRRIDAFELWCWKRLLRVHWTPRRSNQSIPKEISPEYPLEGLMPKLKLQYFGLLVQRAKEKKPWC